MRFQYGFKAKQKERKMKYVNNLTRQILSGFIKVDQREYTTIIEVDLQLVVDAFQMDVLGMQRLICRLGTQKEPGSEKSVCLTLQGHKVFEITIETYEAVCRLPKTTGNIFEDNIRTDLKSIWDLAMQYESGAPEPYKIMLASIH